jgi:pimeloyl-ACP methyl ester carboxylesterase
MVNSKLSVKMSDGTSIGYAEYGDPHGTPVLYFHGCPSSRLEGELLDIGGFALKSNLRIVVPDRPGIGRSDYKPYTIVGWPDMMIEFVDKLGIDMFSVIGTSSGGKYAVACAWKIPHRLTSVHVISSESPTDLPGAYKTLGKIDKIIYTIAGNAPWLLHLILWKIRQGTRISSSRMINQLLKSEPGKGAFTTPEVRSIYEKMFKEAFHQGQRGVALDLMLEAKPWGFSLYETRIPVFVWHGEADKLVPVEQGRIMANAIPTAHARFFQNEGHTLIINQIELLIKSVAGEMIIVPEVDLSVRCCVRSSPQ